MGNALVTSANIQLKDLGGGVYGSSTGAPDLPLSTWNPSTFEYLGAFLLPNGLTPNGGEFNYTGGAIGLAANGNLYVEGKAVYDNDPRVAEVTIPALSTESDVTLLPSATLVQDFIDVINAAPSGNPDVNDAYGCFYSYGGEVIATSVKRYDAAADNKDFIAVIGNPSNFAAPDIKGFYGLGGDYKAAGWISEVPVEWVSSVGSSHIIGNSNNDSIVGRSSVGPSFYGVDLDDIVNVTPADPVPTDEIVSYSFTTGEQLQEQVNPVWTLENTLDRDADPIVPQGNDIFTIISNCAIGFIIPGTSTYAVFGTSGGHATGLGYKITQDDGTVLSGYGPPVAADWSHYHWFYDMNDIVDAKNGVIAPYEAVPYEYGPINTPFEINNSVRGANEMTQLAGGAFDPATKTLYLLQTLDPRTLLAQGLKEAIHTHQEASKKHAN
jgi:hypothetical protein